MNKYIQSLALVIPLALTIGCHRESTESNPAKQPRRIETYTWDELNKTIVPGMSLAAVTKTFGNPGSTIEMDNGTVQLLYSFPLEPQKKAVHLAGFDIYIKDGKVVKWSPALGESHDSFQSGRDRDSSGDQSFQVFLATDGMTNVLGSFDAKGVADASGLKVAPDLAFKAQVFSGDSGKESPGEQTVILVVSEQAASRLKKLTETEANYGKRLLIVSQSKVIAAPAISVPLSSRQVMFKVKIGAVPSSIANPHGL